MKETMAKLVSIISAERLLKQLETIRVAMQFRYIGCQEVHSLRTILMTRRHDGLEAIVLLIDLVKAFDSDNHEIIHKTLSR